MELICHTENTKITQALFLKLPKKLYGKKSPQDIKTEKHLLQRKHPLSPDFRVYPFVVTRRGEPVCRSLLTVYDGEDQAYVGFFEAEQDERAVSLLFATIAEKARELGKTTLVGPLDASIFLGYRFKTDCFQNTFTGEPVNLSYYPDLWKQWGFQEKEQYVSYHLRKVEASDFDMRYEKLYQRYCRRGYQWLSPTKENFTKAMEDVYELLISLYAEFPGFRHIDKKAFMALFSPLKSVLNLQMVRLVYHDHKLCAFCICVPNYADLTLGRLTVSKFFRFLRIRSHPGEYVITYVGASPTAPGLGCAMMQDLRSRLYENGCTTIAALIHEGKLTGRMYESLHVGKRHYALYTCPLEKK